MRAVVHDRYGPPDVLRLDEVDRPVPREDEVLVRVCATTVNRTDCHRRTADPVMRRLFGACADPSGRSWAANWPGGGGSRPGRYPVCRR